MNFIIVLGITTVVVLLYGIYHRLGDILHLHRLDRLERPEIEAFNYRAKRPQE